MNAVVILSSVINMFHVTRQNLQMHAAFLTNDQGHPEFETIILPEITDHSGRGKWAAFGARIQPAVTMRGRPISAARFYPSGRGLWNKSRLLYVQTMVIHQTARPSLRCGEVRAWRYSAHNLGKSRLAGRGWYNLHDIAADPSAGSPSSSK
ncbi:hypothetical protein P692DRAFT_20391399 [Suillus brevipes Sb2]|nr:hypothetical protein P692DRAFT_20391399 [Suillus brevipes Sb2]